MRRVFTILAVAILACSCNVSAQGVRTWYGNAEFMQELKTSIKSFFGDAVGLYVVDGHYLDGFAHSSHAKQAQLGRIGNQFTYRFGRGIPYMQDLPGGYALYSYAGPNDGTARIAIVTPRYGTNVLAAAVTHATCNAMTARQAYDKDATPAQLLKDECNVPGVTAFFEDHASVNSAIVKELRAWGMDIVLGSCQTMRIHQPTSQAYRAYVAHAGSSPSPCRARFDVVTVHP